MITQNILARTSGGMLFSFSEMVESRKRVDLGKTLEDWFEQVKIEIHVDIKWSHGKQVDK